MINLLLTMLFAFIVGYTFDKLKIAGGMMIGSLLGSALFNVLFGLGYMPSGFKILAQIIAGAFIGCSISKQDIIDLKYVYKPVIFVLTMYLILNLVAGTLIYFTSNLDAPTSFMSATPGGMSDIPIISIDFGANPSTVAAMQFVRLVIGVGVFPTMIRNIGKNKNTKQDKSIDNVNDMLNEINNSIPHSAPKISSLKMIALTLFVAIIGGIFGNFIGLSGGVLVFSMIATVCLKLKHDEIVLPRQMRKFAQILSGSFIGCTMTIDDFIAYKDLVLPIIILITCYLLNCLISGYILHKKFGFDLQEGMLATSPAGATDMALISQDMGIQSPRLVVIHVVRLISVIAFFPAIIQVVLNLFFVG